jgi:Protein of unknown function (DUF2568)
MSADDRDSAAASPLAGAGPARTAFLAFRFAMELVTLAVLAWTGASAGGGPAVRVILAIGLPVVLIVIWGLVMAPTARRRLRDPARLVAELVLFLGSAAGLAVVGHVIPAVIYAVVAAGGALATRWLTPDA